MTANQTQHPSANQLAGRKITWIITGVIVALLTGGIYGYVTYERPQGRQGPQESQPVGQEQKPLSLEQKEGEEAPIPQANAFIAQANQKLSAALASCGDLLNAVADLLEADPGPEFYQRRGEHMATISQCQTTWTEATDLIKQAYALELPSAEAQYLQTVLAAMDAGAQGQDMVRSQVVHGMERIANAIQLTQKISIKDLQYAQELYFNRIGYEEEALTRARILNESLTSVSEAYHEGIEFILEFEDQSAPFDQMLRLNEMLIEMIQLSRDGKAAQAKAKKPQYFAEIEKFTALVQKLRNAKSPEFSTWVVVKDTKGVMVRYESLRKEAADQYAAGSVRVELVQLRPLSSDVMTSN